MRRTLLTLALVLMLAWPGAGRAAHMQFMTSDGVRLHFIEEGPRDGHTIVFVPGWTMPAWIFQPQIDAFARRYHVVALDPRGQGDSDAPASGYDHIRRGQDIAELLAALGGRPVLLVGWSLGVLDSLAYVREHGEARVAGLVLIDNSVGEDPPPVASRPPVRPGPRLARDKQMRRFVAGMFQVPPGAAYLAALTDAALRTPPDAAAALSSYPAPRAYWRDAVWGFTKPVLYAVRPRFAAQAANLVQHRPGTETALFDQAGHALFVDEAARFNGILDGFIRRRVWP